jgi:hypothetical protein
MKKVANGIYNGYNFSSNPDRIIVVNAIDKAASEMKILLYTSPLINRYIIEFLPSIMLQ